MLKGLENIEETMMIYLEFIILINISLEFIHLSI